MRIPSVVQSLLSSKQDSVLDGQQQNWPSTSSCPPSNGLLPFTQSRTSKTYRQLKRDCIRRNQLFVDLDFPPTNESLFLDDKSWNGTNLDIEWKRPGEIVENPKLFVEGASPFDVTQGILGNCWFVSACSALTHNEALLQKVIPDPQGQEWAEGNQYSGIFQFSFWRFGHWVDVLIDDLLPCKDGKLLFARSKTPNEFWSALLEKAFAKLYGCYENLVGGQLADALQDVSGGVAESLNVRRFLRQQQQPAVANGTSIAGGGRFLAPPSLRHPAAVEGARRLFYTLKHAFDREALIVAAIAAKKEEVERSLDCGLVMGHAYAVTAIRYIELDAAFDMEAPDRGEKPLAKRQAMVRLQNPWGEKEWNGPWSDGSAEWEMVTAAQKRRLGIAVDEDGEFWMPWEEFVRHFTDISVCQLLNTQSTLEQGLSRQSLAKASRRSIATIGMPEKQFREWTFFGRWSNNGAKSGAPRDRAGGCLNFPATFCFNPQFIFDVPGPGPAELMFALSQKDEFVDVPRGKSGRGRRGKQRQPYLVVGLHLMRVEANRRHRIHQAINPVATSEYSSGRSVYLHVGELPPGRYILIPSTYAPREEAEFMLRIYSTSRTLNPVLLEEDMPRGFSGCGFRARCITRLRIVDLEMFGQLQKECDLFCRVTNNGKESVRTAPVVAEPGQPVLFNDSFIFHSHCRIQQQFSIELFEQRRPFRRRNKCLGRARLQVPCDQNDCLVKELLLLDCTKAPKETEGKTPGKLRIQVCSYDDPLYL